MLATRQSLHSARLSLRRPLHLIPRLRLTRAFATAPRTAQRLRSQTDEEYVRTVREQWGNNLPEGLLSHAEFTVYQRYYGQPARMLKEGEAAEWEPELAPEPSETVTLQDKDGVGIEVYEEGAGEEGEGEEAEGEGQLEQRELEDIAVDVNSPREARAYEQLRRDVEGAFRRGGGRQLEEVEMEDGEEENDDDGEQLGEEDVYMRTHPLTSIGRFATFPYTVIVPPSVQLPTLESLSSVPNKHLDQAAHKILGGPGLPDLPVFRNKVGKNLRDVWLSAEDSRMSDISSEVFLATVVPGYYSQALGALTELRRRLGGDWVLGQGDESGVKNILDVGAGGAAVLAWKDIVEAEHARRRELAGETEADAGTDAADATAGLKATVICASDPLRHRVSKFLENTTFLPRLPDRNPDNVFHTPGQPPISFSPNLKQPRKLFDLIIATNNLHPLRENHLLKKRLRELWSHLSPTGGILLFLEKGTPLGFEAIARVRSAILKSYIASPDSPSRPIGGNTGLTPDDDPIPKEPGAIIAPCTSHGECPLFPHSHIQGIGRRDWCRFPQRYERPSYLQRIIGEARANHEDLQYSFVAVRRGVDYRADADVVDPRIDEFVNPPPPSEGSNPGVVKSPYSMRQLRRYAFEMPRMVMQPIKRRGHVILDVCTPAGAIERWTVPKSYGKVAFRDARKSRWGDLWALGAKTKVLRNIKIGGERRQKEGRAVRGVDGEGGEQVERVVGRPKHWSRGRSALGENVQRVKEKKRSVRWAAQREDMQEEGRGESY
ncbi:37S ribosomal protein S22 [Maublancomyces gigas]|uniref:37S ribosomal protein S22 n=1 Tax=Discina gigas TaxID=1032678 RepID=A0ABR3G7X0_9PEZI